MPVACASCAKDPRVHQFAWLCSPRTKWCTLPKSCVSFHARAQTLNRSVWTPLAKKALSPNTCLTWVWHTYQTKVPQTDMRSLDEGRSCLLDGLESRPLLLSKQRVLIAAAFTIAILETCGQMILLINEQTNRHLGNVDEPTTPTMSVAWARLQGHWQEPSGGFYFICDRDKHRNAKRYNFGCNSFSSPPFTI